MVSVSVIFCVVFINFFAIHSAEELQTAVNNENALTFNWYEGTDIKKVNIVNDDKNPHPTKHLAENFQLYRDLNGTVKLGATNFSSEHRDSIAWRRTAGFVDTIFYGYQQHHNVIIRPDDIWTAIMVQFSLYVNANSETLRHSFVNFEGKKDLVVAFRSRIDEVDIREFISRVDTLIEENIEPSVHDWILPNFATTTENDKLTIGVAMMATLQNYFDYEFWGIVCGIPKATILGTVDDWKEIRKRVERLKDFEVVGKTVMAQWSSMLGRILDEFVSVKQGNQPDRLFWEQAIRIDYKIHDLICAKINETTLNGWLATFSAFDLQGKWRGPVKADSSWLSVRTDKITPGIVHVPIKIYDEYAEPDERNYTGAIITGHMGYSVKEDETTIQPFSGWIMMITNDAPEYIRKRNKV